MKRLTLVLEPRQLGNEQGKLYIGSPIQGRTLGMTIIPACDSTGLAFLTLVKESLSEHLTQLGAKVVDGVGGPPLQGANLLLKLGLSGSPGEVTCSYGWLSWPRMRNLSRYLTEAVAERANLINGGPRLTWQLGQQGKRPMVTLFLPSPCAGLTDVAEPVVKGIAAGLTRYWADPVLRTIARQLKKPPVRLATKPPAKSAAEATMESTGDSETVWIRYSDLVQSHDLQTDSTLTADLASLSSTYLVPRSGLLNITPTLPTPTAAESSANPVAQSVAQPVAESVAEPVSESVDVAPSCVDSAPLIYKEARPPVLASPQRPRLFSLVNPVIRIPTSHIAATSQTGRSDLRR